MIAARTALALSVATMLVLIAVTLTRSPVRVVRVGEPRPLKTLGSTTGPISVCQEGETLPAKVSAIRAGLEGSLGPPVLLRAFAGGRIVAEGSRSGNWTDDTVTIPVKPLSAGAHSVKLCLYVRHNDELLQLYGAASGSHLAAYSAGGQRLPGRFSVEYLASDGNSWWSRVVSVARHVGIGHAFAGTWVALLLAMLVAALASLLVGLAWKELP
ncbi:MAG TPA: hypothetical protein VFR48_00725 [Solirubrobacteraceae bacterium]|nr:hypothetical protein [Solirubrobacteraceae bacterium]